MIVRATTVAALMVLAGCATVPNVDYHQLGPGVRNDAWLPFRLTDSIIVIGAPGTPAKDGDAAPPIDLVRQTVRCPDKVCAAVAITVVPTDFRGALYGLAPHGRRLVSTTAAPTYVANSLRLKTLTVEAKDHRLEAINTVATLAIGAAHLVGKGMDLSNDDPTDRTARLTLPVTIALADARCDAAACKDVSRPLPLNPAWTYTVAFRDDPAANGLLPRRAVAAIHAAMVASACRPIRLVLHQADQNVTVVLETAVADPEWLMTVPFPTKGALTFHSLCGVDVQAQAVTEIGVDSMATAFVNGVEQIAKPN